MGHFGGLFAQLFVGHIYWALRFQGILQLHVIYYFGAFILFYDFFTYLKHAHVTLKLVFFTLTVTFMILALADFTESKTLTRIGGVQTSLWGDYFLYGMCRSN